MSFVLCGRSHGGRCVVKMTEVEKKSGIYESNDGNDVIVDGKKYPITIPVANWIRDKNYQSGLNVTFEIKGQNGRTVVTKVYPTPSGKPASEPTKEELDRSREEYNATAAKMKTAGFGQPTPGPSPDTAHKEVPAAGPAKDPGLKSVEGQIIAIDKPAHKITLKDRAGEHHTFVWGPANDADFQKLEQWWFCKVTGEHQEDFDIWKAMGTGFFKRPDDWPARGGAYGGNQYQPRNERLIVLQSCAKLAAEVYAITTTPDTQDFDQAMDTIIARAIKDTETLMKNGGA